MSEYSVESYFLEKEAIQQAVGSKSKELKEKILKKSSILLSFSERFSEKKLKDAITELVDGDIEKGYPFHYSFAAWALVDEISETRPENPVIGYPFISLYDLLEVLDEEDIYPSLRRVFESLNGMNLDYVLPIKIGEWGDMPCISYLESVDKTIADEAIQMKQDIENEEDWIFNFDDNIDDVLPILDWLLQAHLENKSICLVLEGDL